MPIVRIPPGESRAVDGVEIINLGSRPIRVMAARIDAREIAVLEAGEREHLAGEVERPARAHEKPRAV